MTQNQLRYRELIQNQKQFNRSQTEVERHNTATEAETMANNMRLYAENVRSHLANEELTRSANSEIARANKAREYETNRSNIAKESETRRSNLAREAENYRSNLARETETNRSNLAQEAWRNASLQEQVRSNKAHEAYQYANLEETKHANKMSAILQYQRNVTAENTLLEQTRHNQVGEELQQEANNIAWLNWTTNDYTAQGNVDRANADAAFTDTQNEWYGKIAGSNIDLNSARAFQSSTGGFKNIWDIFSGAYKLAAGTAAEAFTMIP